MVANPASIGRYQVRGTLGVGGFATVYRARDPGLERDVALKVLHPQFARDAATRERFVREGRALARVRHPNLVVVYEAGEADGATYLATELIEGRALDDELALRGRLSLDEVTAIAEQVAGALAALHARGLVHRDVKPANIMLETETGRAVLLDLGIARDLARVTAAGDLLGTPAYMAPEQLRPGGATTAQTDVYQLGATVYMLLAGRPPFAGESFQLLRAVESEPPPDLGDLRPDLPPAVGAAVMAALAKDPDQRPTGPRAFAERLRRPERPRTLTVPAPMPETLAEALRPGWAMDDGTVQRSNSGSATRDGGRPGGLGRRLTPLVSRPPSRRRRLAAGLVLAVLVLGSASILLVRTRLGAGAGTAEPFAPRPEDTAVALAFDGAGDIGSFVMPHRRPDYEYATETGEFVVRTSAIGRSNSGHMGVPPQVGDAVTAVDVRLDGQIVDASVRLSCRVRFSGPNFSGYFVWLDPIEGRFGLHRQDLPPEDRLVELVQWQQSDAINRGTAVNRLMLRCVGDTISVIINGHEVGSARDGAYRSGFSGVEALRGGAVRGELEARFDNFIIARP